MYSGFTAFSTAYPARTVRSDEAPYAQYARQCRRVGVAERHIVTTETIQSLAIEALQKLFSTLSPQHPKPTALVLSSAKVDGDDGFIGEEVAQAIGAAFDIHITNALNYACSGFAAGAQKAVELREHHENVALICSEVPSPGLHFGDPSSAVLFGDGAVATSVSSQGKHQILSAFAEEFEDPRHSLGKEYGLFRDFDGTERQKLVFRMDGEATFRTASEMFPQLVLPVIKANQGTPMIIIPHQPSAPLLRQFESSLHHHDIEIEIVNDLERKGNLVSAAAPSAIADYLPKIAPGTLVITPTVGGARNLEDGKMSRGLVTFLRGV